MKSMLIIGGSMILAPLFADLFERQGWSVVICFDRQCAIHRLAGEWPYDSILVGPGERHRRSTAGGLIRGFEHRRTAAVVVIAERPEANEEALAAG